MPTVVERSYCLQTNSKQVSTEITLIRAAVQRSELIGLERSKLTFEERQIVWMGERAFQQLLQIHWRLILGLVFTYQKKGYNLKCADLKHEATLAFFDAVTSFNPNKGAKLSTWAYIHIRARLQKITRQPIHDAIAKSKVIQTDFIFNEPEPTLEQNFGEQIRSVFNKLTKKQRQVVSLYLEDLGWTEIARRLQSTADAVRMLWTRAVHKLRLLLLEEKQRQEHNFAPFELQPVQETKNFCEPLLRQLLQPISPRFDQLAIA